MEEKTVYAYDEKYIFSGEVNLDDTDKSPSGSWNIPAWCTDVEPPIEKEGFVRIWNGKIWEYIEDHRGKKYWMPDEDYKSPGHEVTEIGPLPEGASNTAPQPTAEELQAQALATLDAEYKSKFDELDGQIVKAAALKNETMQDELIAERAALVDEYTQKRGEL